MCLASKKDMLKAQVLMGGIGFMAARLTPISSGVAHSSAHRTRLKVPKNQMTVKNIPAIKTALKAVAGVRDVRVVPPIGSVIIEHEDRADVLEQIGQAIEKASPELFCLLTSAVPDSQVPLASLFTNLFKEELEDSKNPQNLSAGNEVKRLVPYAFLAAGLIQILEGEALFASVGPLALHFQ